MDGGLFMDIDIKMNFNFGGNYLVIIWGPLNLRVIYIDSSPRVPEQEGKTNSSWIWQGVLVFNKLVNVYVIISVYIVVCKLVHWYFCGIKCYEIMGTVVVMEIPLV